MYTKELAVKQMVLSSISMGGEITTKQFGLFYLSALHHEPYLDHTKIQLLQSLDAIHN